MKEELKASITDRKEGNAESYKRAAIIDKLAEICTIDSLPEGLLDERVAKYREQMEAMCKEQYQMELSEYLASINKTEEEFHTEIVDYMKENIELELMLTAIAEKEGMKVDKEGYQAYVDNMVNQYGFEDAQGLYDEYGEDYIEDSYLCNKAMEYLVENVTVNYQ